MLSYLFPFKSGLTSDQTLRNKVDFWSFLGHNWLKSSFLLSVAMRRVGVMSPQSSEKGIPRERSLRWPILWRTYYSRNSTYYIQATSISKEKEKSCGALRTPGLTWRGHAYSNTINDITAQLFTGPGQAHYNIHCKKCKLASLSYEVVTLLLLQEIGLAFLI